MPNSADSRAAAAAPGPTTTDAQLAAVRFQELSAEIRGCAVLDGSGAVIASTGDAAGWAEPADDLFAAADAAVGKPVSHAHVATEEGEVFAVRHGASAMVAVTARFTLASLILSDMRATLRELARGGAVVKEAAA